MAKKLTLDEVRAKWADEAKKAGCETKPDRDGGGNIAIAEADNKLLIEAELDKPFALAGKNKKTGEEWCEIVYASTIKSSFVKSMRYVREDGTALRIQVKVSEERPKS